MALWQDLRYAGRPLVKDRWFTMVAATALALGIGVNATVFTFINAVLLRGLPFENPDRIMFVGTRDAKSQERGLSIADFEDWRSRATLLEHLVLWAGFAFNLSDAGREPDRFQGAFTVNAFMPTIIGVMPPDLTFPANNHLWVPLVHMPPGVRPTVTSRS